MAKNSTKSQIQEGSRDIFIFFLIFIDVFFTSSTKLVMTAPLYVTSSSKYQDILVRKQSASTI